jgi:hypothetical protein
MGILKGKFIVGPVGPLNFRVVNGKNIVSAKMVKGTMKQTKATIRVAGIFGIANRLSSEMMGCLKKPLSGFQDNMMYKRLTGRLNHIFYHARDHSSDGYSFTDASFNALADFDFNIHSPLKVSLNTRPVVSLRNGLLRVELTDLDNPNKIHYPRSSKNCEIVVSMSLFRLREGLKTPEAEYQRLKLKRDQTAISNHDFTFSVPEGCLCTVAINMYYYSVTDKYISVLNNRKFSPGSICAAFYVPGDYANTDGRKWFDMRRLTINVLP